MRGSLILLENVLSLTKLFYVRDSSVQYLFVGICILLSLDKIEVLGTVKRDRCPDEKFVSTFKPSFIERILFRKSLSMKMANLARVEGLCAYPAFIIEDDWLPFLGLPTEIEPLLLVHIAYFSDNCGSINIKFSLI
jgi:hypothetical protein